MPWVDVFHAGTCSKKAREMVRMWDKCSDQKDPGTYHEAGN